MWFSNLNVPTENADRLERKRESTAQRAESCRELSIRYVIHSCLRPFILDHRVKFWIENGSEIT